jgi:DNA-binding NtrC family response regulator
MADKVSVLIVEDDKILAMNLVAAAEDRGCTAVGPEASVADALAVLRQTRVDAAVLDANLLDRDVTPVAMALIEQAIPFVIHTGKGLPEELAAVFPHVSVIMKPADPDDVVAQVLSQLEQLRAAGRKTAPSPTHAASAHHTRARTITKVAGVLFDQFGDQAIVLARRQAADASDDVLATWSDIIANLAMRAPAEDPR